MRRFLSSSFIFLALVLGPAYVLHAQAASPVGTETPVQYQANPDAGFGGVMAWIMSLFAWLVGVAAITLDNAVYYTVVTMGDYVHKLSAVGVSWRILRDIGNIMLIFGFLAVGITTILNDEISYGTGKKMLPMMLVAAVFLNFSLFITEAIVDTGNIFATQFYTQINGGKPAQPTGYSIDLGVTALGKGQVSSEPISNAIMGRLGLQTLYNVPVNKEIFAAGNTWIIGFMGILLFLTTAFVMFSLAFILIARFVALLFLIIIAPIGFAGLAIPGFAARAKDYWEKLFEQTITAPILLLMLYIALAIITDANFLTGLCVSTDPANRSCTPNAVGWVNGNFQGFAGFILSFLVAIAALLLVIVYAKKWSAFGGDWASRTAAKATFGATAWAGRNSGGWIATRSAKYLRATPVARVPLVGTGLVKGLEKVGASSFDVRGTNVLKNVPLGSNIDAGAAQKGGYKADLKARIESRTKYAADLKGRDLTDDEKANLAIAQNELAKLKKSQAEAETREEFQAKAAEIKAQEKKIEGFEEFGDKGAKRKYAQALNLWTDDKNFFNKYINFASNTEAAKKIREDAKKSSEDKELDTLRKALKKAGGDEGKTPSPTAAATPAPAGEGQ
ncbi:MAG: hypothetical protein PHV99_02910 [Candidatus Pacebacteria bacterium]|nr:hypothetical protein [Candidatus Paceibacterota bacterium]